VALGAFYLLRDGDRLEQAQQALLRGRDYATEAHALAQAAGDPFSSVLTSGNLGEVDLHLGELEEAEALLRPALKLALEHGLQAHVWRLRCALAELSLMRGNATRAHQGMSALLADLTDVASVPTRLRVHTLMYRACKALNLTAEALLHLEALHQMERRSSTVQLEAQSRFFVTRLEAEQARLLAEHRHAAAPQPASGAESAPDELDPLTGLRNRRHLESTMPGLMRSAEAREAALTLALIDVDHMKQVNTEFGYAAGDQVLQRLADMLRDNTRGSDILVRMDGEEFLVVFPDTVADRAFEVCERLREHVELHPWQDVAPGLHVTLSIGLASAPPSAGASDAWRRASAPRRALFDAQRGQRRIAVGVAQLQPRPAPSSSSARSSGCGASSNRPARRSTAPTAWRWRRSPLRRPLVVVPLPAHLAGRRAGISSAWPDRPGAPAGASRCSSFEMCSMNFTTTVPVSPACARSR
jgi:diguanylate cyclase (GGDEF)-like protein